MRLNSPTRLFTAVVLLLYGLTISFGLSAATATATATINVTYIIPVCSISLPSSVSLGTFSENGVNNFSPFNIDINCPYSVEGALFAEIIQGGLVTGSTTRVEMINSTSSNSGPPAQLWLTEPGGNEVVLDGMGATDQNQRFCGGSTTRQCSLTPYVQVDQDTPRGELSTVLRFNIAYP